MGVRFGLRHQIHLYAERNWHMALRDMKDLEATLRGKNTWNPEWDKHFTVELTYE